MRYKIGQILTSNCDVEVEKIFGEKVIIPKGNKVIIGADKLAHHIKTGTIQPLQAEAIVDGYDSEGIAEYIFKHLNAHFSITELLEELGVNKEVFMDVIEFALDEIGFC